MAQMQWLEQLTQQQRKSFVFMLCYEKARRQIQRGYKAVPELGPDVVERPTFKQCSAVVAWLEQEGWEISWREVHWQGFVKHAFAAMAPTVPMPGQLRNWRLLRSYLASAPQDERHVRPRSDEEMQRIYAKALRPEVLDHGGLQIALGLRPVE